MTTGWSTARTPAGSSPRSRSGSKKAHSRPIWGCRAMSVVAIAGSSGLIGSALVYALRATDNRVLRIVRRAPSNADELFWNPDAGEFDAGRLRGVDAVVNLCGVSVGAKR